MFDPIFGLLMPAFIGSFLVTALIAATKRWHGRFTLDGKDGVQKVHKAPTPRVGGVGILLGLALSLFTLPSGIEARDFGLFLLVAAIPVITIGLWEDISKSVSPKVRLISHFVSAAILVIAGDYILRHSGFTLTDQLMKYTPLAAFISIFAVAGMTNAVNIIDGYNGLASGTVLIMTAGLALLAIRLGDIQVLIFCLCFGASVFGFFIVNYPLGKVFLGDAGAYFCGFIICALVLILAARHPGLSPWVPLLIIIYPVWEVFVSIVRRVRRDGHSPSQPDRVHLHNLVSRSFARPVAKRLNVENSQNPLTGLAVWPFPLLAVLISANTPTTSISALLGIFVFQGFYDRIYKGLSLKRR